MRKYLYAILLIINVLALYSCKTEHHLYYWGDVDKNGENEYQLKTYADFRHHSVKSVCSLIDMYEYIIAHEAEGENAKPAPGLCADYGFLLLKQETLAAYVKQMERQGEKVNVAETKKLFHDRGIEMINREMELYPQSEKFLKSYLVKITDDEK